MFGTFWLQNDILLASRFFNSQGGFTSFQNMQSIPRHQCLIYSGDPGKQLAALAGSIRAHLERNYRCLYLNSPTMVDKMWAYLTASGLNVAEEAMKQRLVLTSDRSHLRDGSFDPNQMMEMLKTGVEDALQAGHAGLWASGDMAWEFGEARDFSKLLEYERALEEYFRLQPALRGVCQYHADMMPREAAEIGARSHPATFVNQTLSKINPRYAESL